MWGILPPISAYSFRHLHSSALQPPVQATFSALTTLSYHAPKGIRGFGDGLQVPTIFGANPLDW